MNQAQWLKQGSEPLFPDMLWSRPENRRQAGKLLIIGGNLHGFAAAANGYQQAQKAGVGQAQIILPGALQKTVGKIVPEAQFVPSTPSGSFARAALAEWLDAANWADAVLLAGDFGHNSETALTLEDFAHKYTGHLVITKDALDVFYSQPLALLDQPKTTMVLSLAQLQKLAAPLRLETPLLSSMGQEQLVTWLQELSQAHPTNLVLLHQKRLYVASGGRVSATPASDPENWQIATASYATVWWLQNPGQPFEALTTGVYEAEHQ